MQFNCFAVIYFILFLLFPSYVIGFTVSNGCECVCVYVCVYVCVCVCVYVCVRLSHIIKITYLLAYLLVQPLRDGPLSCPVTSKVYTQSHIHTGVPQDHHLYQIW